MSDPMKPSPALLAQLGSIIVHVEEWMSPGGHPFDEAAIKSILASQDVQEWLKLMSDNGMVPVKRTNAVPNSPRTTNEP